MTKKNTPEQKEHKDEINYPNTTVHQQHQAMAPQPHWPGQQVGLHPHYSYVTPCTINLAIAVMTRAADKFMREDDLEHYQSFMFEQIGRGITNRPDEFSSDIAKSPQFPNVGECVLIQVFCELLERMIKQEEIKVYKKYNKETFSKAVHEAFGEEVLHLTKKIDTTPQNIGLGSSLGIGTPFY
jgi:hypothetical protein